MGQQRDGRRIVPFQVRGARRFTRSPSEASSFSIRTKIRSSDPAIVASVTSLFPIRRRE